MSEPMTPEILDGLADTDPLRLKNEAIYLLATVGRLRAELVEARRDAHDARIDYNLARTRADKAEAERDRLRAELARRDRVAAEPMDDALRLHTSCVECMDRPVVPGSDFCPDCKELVAAESSSPSGEQG